MKLRTALLGLLPLASAIAVGACAAPEDDVDDSEGALVGASEDGIWSSTTWNQKDRDAWYSTPQGSHLLDLGVFKALEQPTGSLPFASRASLEALGFIYPPNAAIKKVAGLPDGLPIGVVADRNEEKGRDDVGFTCAACHTGQLTLKGKRVIIEGGQPFFQFAPFLDALKDAIKATSANSAKMKSFCTRLGDEAKCKERLEESKKRIEGISSRNKTTAPDGPGRLDAISRIMNEVFGDQLGGEKPGDVQVPVSFPVVWDVPRLQCVQTNCMSSNSMTRNIGEVLGVFGHAAIVKQGGQIVGMKSTAKIDNLFKLEHALESLPSPKWSSLVGKVDSGLASKGEKVFASNCATCHAESYKGEKAPETAFTSETGAGKAIKLWAVTTVPYREVGTDPRFIQVHGARMVDGVDLNLMFDRALKGKVAQGITAMTGQPPTEEQMEDGFAKANGELIAARLRAPTTPANDGKLSSILALGVVTLGVEYSFFTMKEPGAAKREQLRREYEFFRAPPSGGDLAVYRARPLNGIAFSAPYGHNGAWPTLADVLEPTSKRPETFAIRPGSMDTDRVGLDIKAGKSGDFTLDTNKPGNSRAGHECKAGETCAYGTNLSSADKRALLEYLKSI